MGIVLVYFCISVVLHPASIARVGAAVQAPICPRRVSSFLKGCLLGMGAHHTSRLGVLLLMCFV
jgi:hypothetical protein